MRVVTGVLVFSLPTEIRAEGFFYCDAFLKSWMTREFGFCALDFDWIDYRVCSTRGSG